MDNSIPDVIWRPVSKFQEVVLQIPEDVDIFLPGGRGSGKTSVVVIAAIRHCLNHKESFAMFYRINMTDAQGLQSEIEKYALAVGAKRKGVGSNKVKWTFPNRSQIMVMYLDKLKDADTGQGENKTLNIFDEVGKYDDLSMVDKVRGSLRTNKKTPTRTIMCANPGGGCQTELKARYQEQIKEGVIADVRINNANIKSVWLNSDIRDNPLCDTEQYRKMLLASGPPWLVDMWLNNDWSQNPDAYWAACIKDKDHIVEPFKIPSHWMKFRSMDWGYRAPAAIGWWAIDEHGTIHLYDEMYTNNLMKPKEGLKIAAPEVANMIKERERSRGDHQTDWAYSYADIPGESGSSTSVLADFIERGIYWEKRRSYSGYRIDMVQEITGRLHNTLTGQGNGIVFFNHCVNTIEQMKSIPADPKRLEDIVSDNVHADHAVEMVKVAVSIWRTRSLTKSQLDEMEKKKRAERYKKIGAIIGTGQREYNERYNALR